MTIILTKKNASSIARAIKEKSELSYMQGLDLLAFALGYSSNAALMAALETGKGAAPQKSAQPILLHAKKANGELIASIDMTTFLKNANDDMLAHHSVKEWKSPWLSTDILQSMAGVGEKWPEAISSYARNQGDGPMTYEAPAETLQGWLEENRPGVIARINAEPVWKRLPKLTAEAHSDKPRIKYTIDARPHFWNITLTELEALRDCDWSGDYPSDAIYDSACDADCPEALKLNDLLLKLDSGFEVSIDQAEVQEWLRENRPEIYEKAKEIFDDYQDELSL